MTTTVWTIGYEGTDIDAFVRRLVAAHVEVLCDVRRRALSRKPGFSKRALAARLAAVGIDYMHLPALGMPTDLLPYRNAHDNSPILAIYEAQLPQQEGWIAQIGASAEQRRLCLLCFEADHRQCHRGVLADRLASKRELQVHHL